MRPTLALSAALLSTALPALAEDAPAGLFAATNKKDLPEIILSAGEPLGDPWVLKSGTYYEVEITSDGSQELALTGPEFFRAIWIDEIVIEGIEIRPLGLDSVEFDEAGTMEIGFIAIKPGSYTLRTPQGGETQTLQITIE
ncbi:hypothetical protein [Rhodobacter calidifons]|uniref:MSP domain-containing protein n=1 Tax=Rhodobacter calidifons TaxID=2715277 RepID=A0ABX0GBN4_9RHOB|nr:hypothetical protein [Rhodobacter calidifons]NHB78531.1 hypothetical protein [Rhodobacter calidifons]